MKLRLTSRIVLVFVCFVAALLGIVGLLSYKGGSDSVQTAAVSELVGVAIEKEAALRHWMANRLADLGQLSTDAELKEKVRVILAADRNSPEARSAHASLMTELVARVGGPYAGFTELFAMDAANGIVLVSTDAEAEGTSKIDRAYFTLTKTGPSLQGTHFSAERGNLRMTATAPICAADGSVIALLAARLDLAALNGIAQRRTGLRQTDDSFLIDGQGFLVSRPRLIPETGGSRRQIDTGAVRLCLEGKSGVILETDDRGIPVIAAYRWIPDRQLGLIVKLDQAEAFAPARAFGRSVLVISGFGLLATAGLAFLLARRITHPLRAMHESVRRFAEQQIEEPLAESAGGELGILAGEFNRMQVRIRQRTQELAESNNALRAENAERKRAEEAMRQSAERFCELADHITDVFYMTSLDVKEVYYVSKAYETIWGYPIESVYTKPQQWIDAVLPEDRERVHAMFAKLGENAPTFSVEYRIRRSDGVVRWVHSRGFLVRDAAGRAVRGAGITTDITERKYAEEASRQSEEKFRELADNIADVFWMASADMREFQYVSKAYEKVWGTSMQGLYDNPNQWTDAILPEDRDRVQSTFAKLSENESSVSAEYRICRPDGAIRWIHDRGFLVRDAAGNSVRRAGVAADITELKQSAESLLKSEAHKSAIVESALDCIVTMDADGNITEFNPSAEETFGHERASVLGRNLAEVIVPPAWRADHLKNMAVYLATGEAGSRLLGKRVERSALRADGTEFPVEFAMSGAMILGKPSITMLIRDITERKDSELRVEGLYNELVDASRRAGMAEVATGVLHNVGNVLNSINISTSIVRSRLKNSRVSRLIEVSALLAEHASDLPAFLTLDERGNKLPEFLTQLAIHLNRETQEMAEEMRTVAENVDHVKEIVSTQQNYAGNYGVLEPLDLRDLVEDVLRIHGAALSRHDVEVIKQLEPVPPVIAEKHKVLQILVNLIGNANSAMAKSEVRTLTIRTVLCADGRVQISVQDTGCGIPPENLTLIFAHGFTTKPDGHGFGLHSSALAASEMNATLIAASDGPGKGSLFTIVFPMPAPSQLAA